MPDFRVHPSIGERNNLRWFRGTVSLRRWYGRLSALAMLAAAALVAGFTLWGDERVYWSAPVSHAHASFQQDCNACHVQQGQPLLRLARLDDAHHSVRDADCQACHAQQSDDHSPRQMAGAVTGCVQCHREHVGREKLADVADRQCIACHADLATKDGARSFDAHVASFAEHPEFLLHRDDEQSHALADARRVKPEAPHAPPRQGDLPAEWSLQDKWRDPTKLRFNHRLHLAEQGVLVPPPGEGRKQLACADCHVPDAAGEYMRPINYEQHCQSCHALEFSGKASGALPHEQTDVVSGTLRDRLLRYIEVHPEELAPPPLPRLPNKSPTPAAQDQYEWVEQELAGAEQAIFLRNVKNGCAQCHELEERQGDGALRFRVVPPNMPERWFTASRFDHGKHREVSCAQCHQQANGSAAGSAKTSDILLPNIETCRACHGEHGEQTTSAPRVRSHCVDCHDYHAPHAGSGKLDAWTK